MHGSSIVPCPLTSLAISRLRALFAGSRCVKELDHKIKLAALMAATGNMTHCARKGCPFPPVRDGMCRQHAADAVAQYSTTPSMLGVAMIPQPRASSHAHA
jgi:hypothetical protein